MVKNNKFAILNLYDDNIEYYAKYTEEINKIYANKYGYKYILHKGSLDTERVINWSKILLLLDSMEKYPKIEWFWWLDSDAIITNMDITLESIISMVNSNSIIITSKFGSVTNTGSFLIKNCDMSKQLLKEAYGMTQYLSHRRSEESAIERLLTVRHGSYYKHRRKVWNRIVFIYYIFNKGSTYFGKVFKHIVSFI
jgi:uncharacterized protein YebE (UPF0316 family)